jgi:hypothetical protein
MKTLAAILILLFASFTSALSQEPAKLCNEDQAPSIVAITYAKPLKLLTELVNEWNEKYAEIINEFKGHVFNDILITVNCEGDVVKIDFSLLRSPMIYPFGTSLHEDIKAIKWTPGEMEELGKIDMVISWRVAVSGKGLVILD